jgi:hypothetical protein
MSPQHPPAPDGTPAAGRLAESSHEVDWHRSLGQAERACCCAAKPAVVVIMPPSQNRPHPVELLLCHHHYRRSFRALATAGAAVLLAGGVTRADSPGSPGWPAPDPASQQS